jgi:hypothetical protein
MKWLRLYTDVKDDPKIRKMDLEEQAVFFLLLTLAAEEEKQGVIPLCLEDIAWSLRVPLELTERVIQKCMDRDILSLNGKGYKFIHWQTRQFPSDNVTERVQRWREGKKSETLHETLPETLQKRCMKQDCNNADRYIDREIETISMSPTATEESKTEVPSVCVSTETTPHDAIVSLYHEILPELPAVKEWTPERQKQLRSRWKEAPKRQDLEWWRQYFGYVRESAFLMGDNKDKWTPNLEWLVKKSHLVNVIEGKYHGRTI